MHSWFHVSQNLLTVNFQFTKQNAQNMLKKQQHWHKCNKVVVGFTFDKEVLVGLWLTIFKILYLKYFLNDAFVRKIQYPKNCQAALGSNRDGRLLLSILHLDSTLNLIFAKIEGFYTQ